MTNQNRKQWLVNGATLAEWEAHVAEELWYEKCDLEEKEWRKCLIPPTEEEMIAEDPSLLVYVRNALKALKSTTPTEKELETWLRTLYDSDQSDDDKMFQEVCFEHLTYPDIQKNERRMWQLKRLLPRRKNAKMDNFPELLERARQVPIVGEIEKYIRIMKCGSKYKALCPFHDEKTPSFYIYPDSNSFYCFGACSTGGDVITFKKLIDGLSFREAVRELNNL